MEEIASNVRDCALVFEGGGYRGCFSAGIANVLLEQGIYFDYVCGLSAGASNTVNYLSRDQWRVKHSFILSGRAKRAVGLPSLLHGGGYFDADFLYEGAVQDGTWPFDWDAFVANPAGRCIQAFERDTGRTLCFRRDELTRDPMRMIDLVRASSTLPGMMKPLPVDGRVLMDGGLGAGAGIPVNMAEEDGYEKFVFVATRPRGYRKKPPTKRDRSLYLAVSRDHPYLRNALLTRWERYNAELDRVEALAREGRCLIIYPDAMDVTSGTASPRKQAAEYEVGHEQGLRELPRIREFVFGSADGGPAPTDEGTGYITLG